MHDGKTPLEIALEREASGEDIDYCDECEYIAIVQGRGLLRHLREATASHDA